MRDCTFQCLLGYLPGWVVVQASLIVVGAVTGWVGALIAAGISVAIAVTLVNHCRHRCRFQGN